MLIASITNARATIPRANTITNGLASPLFVASIRNVPINMATKIGIIIRIPTTKMQSFRCHLAMPMMSIELEP
jgi:hypothetical protein